MKIYVYAICKNESQFVERWVKSMSEADGIYVLDTGSDDDTVEKLKKYGANVFVEKISPWRFDVARNKSLELVPEDADICVCTDLDEEFHKGWRKILEQAWSPDTSCASYRYTWSFNDDGSEGYVFWIEKIHARKGFIWTHPVHEVLKYISEEKEYRKITVPGIQLDHHPDPLKSRGQYLPLLELSVKESPDDDRNMHYLGREYMFYGMWDKCIETLKHHLQMKNATWADERCASMRFIARSYIAKGDVSQAEQWYLRAIAEAPHLREPYIEFAQLLYSQSDWEGIVWLTGRALNITQRPQTYICESEPWGSLPYDLRSLGLFYTGKIHDSLDAAKKALSLSPNDERIKDNISIIERALSLNSESV